MVEPASQWVCLKMSSLKSRRTVASGLVPHSVPLPGSSSANPSVELGEELSSLLTKQMWCFGCVLCGSPRWVLVGTFSGLLSDDVITRSKQWRVAVLTPQDISYRSRHVKKESRINLSSGAKAEIPNMDPHFTTGTCKTLLSAVGVWVDSKSILFDMVFVFDYMRVLLCIQCQSMSHKTILTNW